MTLWPLHSFPMSGCLVTSSRSTPPRPGARQGSRERPGQPRSAGGDTGCLPSRPTLLSDICRCHCGSLVRSFSWYLPPIPRAPLCQSPSCFHGFGCWLLPEPPAWHLRMKILFFPRILKAESVLQLPAPQKPQHILSPPLPLPGARALSPLASALSRNACVSRCLPR